ncbi:MAG: bifunctional riboflavin kinase/FAD synthetase [Caldiserica bacterium]|nr:bifunctional riboflavin kinase/FAD synthetase [Caldisericota bacterium]
MKLRIFPPSEPFAKYWAVSIGVFDGVHLGHQKIIQRLKEIGEEKGYHTAVLTFPYPPSWHMGSRELVPLLMSSPDKLKILRKMGVESVFYLDFHKIKEMSPDDFLFQYLLPCSVKHIVVGENFRFGKNRRGDTQLLNKLCKEAGVGVDIIPALRKKGEVVSSSRIRELVKNGELAEARELLGRPFFVTGRVIAGKGVGKQIGFPTINLSLKHYVLPQPGVYAGMVKVKNESFPAAIDLRKLRKYWCLEAHLLGFAGNLYRKKVEVSMEKFLRDREKTEDITKLKSLIRRDIKIVEELL